MNFVISLVKKPFLITIRIYQIILRPLFPSSCRFHPSCSEYMYQSIEKYGVIKGGLRGVRRISKCHPWNSGGYDPV